MNLTILAVVSNQKSFTKIWSLATIQLHVAAARVLNLLITYGRAFRGAQHPTRIMASFYAYISLFAPITIEARCTAHLVCSTRDRADRMGWAERAIVSFCQLHA